MGAMKERSPAASDRPWICFSSSSGRTFEAMFRALPAVNRASLRGFFTDRSCGATELAGQILGPELVYGFPRKEFETRVLAWIRENDFKDGLIFLCGFFGILTADFLSKCGCAVVNTHPSLLPAFPGKDESVHKKAFEEAAISGFSVHLVNERLDGGPVLFQHPVALDITLAQEQNRERVRAAEQKWLPRIWGELLKVPFTADDRNVSTRELRLKYKINFSGFMDAETLR